MRKFNHGDPLRPEKQQQRDHPKPDRNAAVGGNAGNDVKIEYRDDKQQHQIEASQDAL
jgi:hypothetical protein